MPKDSPPLSLSEDEAATRLGITKELLFAYTRYAPKTHLGHSRKLRVSREGRQYRFSSQDLEEWDRYLHEPWSLSGKDRPPLPTYIDEYLKIECGGRCAKCGKGYKLENAHIDDYPLSLSHHHHNLIRICRECHSGDTDKIIPKAELIKLKTALIQRIRENIEEEGLRRLSRRTVYRIPQGISLFMGRKQELKSLKRIIKKERVIVVEGIGGIGKTQLVIRGLRDTKDVPTIWFDVESYNSFGDVLLCLRLALMKVGALRSAEVALFEALDASPVRIVLDGLDRIPTAQWDEVLEFLTMFTELTSTSRLIITTQIELTSLPNTIFKLRLPPLSHNESRELIRLGCDSRDHLDIGDLDQLASFCDGHALTIQIVIGLLAFYKNSRTVIERLERTGAFELSLPSLRQQRRGSSLKVCLKAAYDCFSDGQKRLLLFVSCFPGGCNTHLAERFQAESDYQIDVAQLRRLFFVDVTLDWWNFERLRLLNPVSEFVRSVWQMAKTEAISIQFDAAIRLMMQAVVRASKFVDSPDREKAQEGLIRIDYDLPNYFYTLDWAEDGLRQAEPSGIAAERYLQVIAGLGKALSRNFFIRGMFERGIAVTERTIQVLLQLTEYDSAATQFEFLATYYSRVHDLEGLSKTSQRLLDLARQTSEPAIEAAASMALGMLAERRREPSQAIEHYEAAANYYLTSLEDHSCERATELGIDRRAYKARLGMLLTAIGTAYNHMNLPQDALASLLKALDYIEQTQDHPNLGVVSHELGTTYSRLGETPKAITAYITALSSFIELGYAEYISNSMGELGCEISDKTFSSKLEEYLTEEMLKAGMADCQYSVKLLLAAPSPPIQAYAVTLRKVFGVMKLISFTSKSSILENQVNRFRANVFDWSGVARGSQLTTDQAFFLHFLMLIMRLVEFVGEISKENRPITKDMVAELCCRCEDFDEFGWQTFEPYEWIAALLNHRGVCTNVDPIQLRGAILDAHDDGGHSEFRLEQCFG